MPTDNVMIYNWAGIEKAIELINAFPWERKLEKEECFSDACEMVALFEIINDVVKRPFVCDTWYAKNYQKKSFDETRTLGEMQKARRECELHIKSEICSLVNGCHSGRFKCVFNLLEV